MDAICVERKEAEEEVKDRFRVLETMDTNERLRGEFGVHMH